MDITSKHILNNKVEMPWLGLGTYKMEAGKQTVDSVTWALEAGYLLIDTAAYYGNESDVGQAVEDMDMRDEVFVTTKLWNDEQGYEKALKAFDESLEKLGFEYVDLYLIHWPTPKLRMDSWKALEKIYEEGLCEAIGVSNYTIRHLQELLGECDIMPQVNQVEFSPFLYQRGLLDYCSEKDIHLQAYTSLTRGERFDDKVLTSLSEKYGKTRAQILLRWAIQHKVSVIPKSSKREHIIENSEIFDFEIQEEDMSALDSLDEGYRVTWDPSEME